MKVVKWLLLTLGFYLLYATIRSVGPGSILSHISSMGWRFFPLLSIYLFIYAFHTLGWAYAFPGRSPEKVRLSDLYLIRIIGETMNALIPFSASLGGEPVKADLLKRRHGVPLSETFASILIVHATFWLSLNIFVIGALALTLKTEPLTPVLWKSVILFLLSLGAVAVCLILGLRLGIFTKIHELGDRLNWWGADSKQKNVQFLKLDERIKSFFTSQPDRFFWSTLYNLLGWLFGLFEVYFIGKMLGMNISWAHAWLFEALIQVLRIITFFIPSSIGAQEGGIVLIFAQFGYASPVALSFALIRRIREIVWLGIGLMLWALMKNR